VQNDILTAIRQKSKVFFAIRKQKLHIVFKSTEYKLKTQDLGDALKKIPVIPAFFQGGEEQRECLQSGRI
jgi:hypothetical protein